MLEYDIDDAIARAEQKVMPWEFAVRVNGEAIPTRPLTLADLHALNGIVSLTEADQREMVYGLLSRRPSSEWTAEQAGAVAVAVASYFKDRVKKKSETLGGDVATAVAAIAGETSGSTSSGSPSTSAPPAS